MKTKHLSLILSTIIGICLVGCSPVLYSPVGQNVPLFEKKGEVMLNGGVCDSDVEFLDVLGGNYAFGYYVQGATAITDKVAITSSFYSMRGVPYEDADASISGSGWYWEFAGGRYGSYQKKFLKWEILAGAGIGSIKNQIDQDHLNLSYFKPFVQPTLAVKWKYIELAFTPKLALINYTSHEIDLTETEKREMAESFFRKNQSVGVYEPGITLRAGLKNIKLQIQTCFTSFNTAGWEGEPAINRLYTSLGITYRFQILRKTNAIKQL